MDFNKEFNNQNLNQNNMGGNNINTPTQFIIPTVQSKDDSKLYVSKNKEFLDGILGEAAKVDVTTYKFNQDDFLNEIRFIPNNWLEDDKNPILALLAKKGAMVYMYTDGTYGLRSSRNGKIKKFTQKSKLQTTLSKIIGFAIRISDEPEEGNPFVIPSTSLLMIEEDTFNPFIKKEFYNKDGVTYRNMFLPTEFMLLPKETQYKNPELILKLISHLTRNIPLRTNWFMNWLASFFQSLKKTPVSCILKGLPGAGKNILTEEILKPLFGESQFSQPNERTLKGDFIQTIIKGKLVINIDETSSKDKKNTDGYKELLKILIGSKTILAQQKYLDIEEPTQLYALIIITSNATLPVEIEPKDRRFTVLTTGLNLKEINFLGFDSYDDLVDAVKTELKDFAIYLKNYEVDSNLAATALDTPEKDIISELTTDSFTNFITAVMKKDLSYFEYLKDSPINALTYNQIERAFNENRVISKDLVVWYNAVEELSLSAKNIMKSLRVREPMFFHESLNALGKDGNGNPKFLINSEFNPYWKEETENHKINNSYANALREGH